MSFKFTLVATITKIWDSTAKNEIIVRSMAKAMFDRT